MKLQFLLLWFLLIIFLVYYYLLGTALKKYFKFQVWKGWGMFCHEVKKALMAYVKIGDIKKASPLPLANISCYNQDYYEAQVENISIEAVIKSSVLFVLALATIIINLIFVLVIRSAKYQRRVQVQVSFLYSTFLSKKCH